MMAPRARAQPADHPSVRREIGEEKEIRIDLPHKVRTMVKGVEWHHTGVNCRYKTWWRKSKWQGNDTL